MSQYSVQYAGECADFKVVVLTVVRPDRWYDCRYINSVGDDLYSYYKLHIIQDTGRYLSLWHSGLTWGSL